MYNILLDRLPSEYHGYLIRTSFRIGIQICLCLKDPDLSQEEQILTAINLLYGKGAPTDINEAINGLSWFMSCGDPSDKPVKEEKPLFYWDFDSARLYSSFKQTYGIDLSREDLHWFEFIDLIGSLDKNCAFNKAIEIRDFDMKGMSGQARAKVLKMKESLTPEVQYSEEEKEQLRKFEALFNGGDVNG